MILDAIIVGAVFIAVLFVYDKLSGAMGMQAETEVGNTLAAVLVTLAGFTYFDVGMVVNAVRVWAFILVVAPLALFVLLFILSLFAIGGEK